MEHESDSKFCSCRFNFRAENYRYSSTIDCSDEKGILDEIAVLSMFGINNPKYNRAVVGQSDP